ncbi:MAG: response regulator [Nitrospinae bacterium]|nr:response regulator [Nitrospinota bacterium]
MPIVDLDVILKVPGEPGLKGHEGEVLAVMVAMGSENLGPIVHSIVSEEDMEIKSLPSHMKKNETVSGVTLTGKNGIALMLHVPKLFALAKAAHILLVEDSVSTREIEKSILSSYGYKVETAVDGLEKAKEARYNLVIADIEMPRMDGFTLTEKLRETEECRNTPIVIVSSRDSESDKKRGMRVGADAYIIKGGFDQTSLLATIQNLIP